MVDEVRKFRVAEARHWLASRVDGAVPVRACEALIEADARIDVLEVELADLITAARAVVAEYGLERTDMRTSGRSARDRLRVVLARHDPAGGRDA